MKAYIARRYGDPADALRLEDVPQPQPGTGEVLLRVHAVTVNRTRDIQGVRGHYSGPDALPMVPGMDPAGEIATVGDGVADLRPGMRVVVNSRTPCNKCRFCNASNDADCPHATQIGIHRWGGYAEYVAVPATSCMVLPDRLSYADAAVTMRHGPTALMLLDGKAGLRPGEWVLVMGAAGGLGSTGVQVAKQLGATVIAGAGADERVAFARSLGADYGINYRTSDLTDEVRRITGGRGVDVVFENISDPTTWPKAFAALAYAGRLVTVGAHGGGTVPLDARRLYLNRLRVIGAAGANRRDAERALAIAAEGKLRAPVEAVMPLARLPVAFALIGEGKVAGKLVIDPSMS